MILNIRHTGLVVRDLERSLKFYQALGFQLWRREIESGSFIDTVVGIDDVKIETAKLRAPDKTVLELLQYHSHPSKKEKMDAPSNQLGCSHVAFTVKNIDESCRLIEGLGGSVKKSQLANNGSVKVTYCHDLDGIIIELVEEIEKC